MPYSQIIALMIALALIAGAPSPETELVMSPAATFFLWVIKTVVWVVAANSIMERTNSPKEFHRLSEKLQWMSLLPLLFDFYILDLKYYIQTISAAQTLPSIIDLAGISLFLFYMSIAWRSSWRTARINNMSENSFTDELALKLRLLFPALLPFAIISVLSDLLSMFQFSQEFMQTIYGRLSVLAAFTFALIFFIPPVIKYLWGCEPVPEGPLRDLLENFTRKEKLSFAEFLIWPLEGRLCTAAVVGIVPAFRYILITPCLLEHLNKEEIEAVLAHECAHVKKRHILWYIFFLSVYSFVIYKLFDTAWIWLCTKIFFVEFLVAIKDISSLTAILAIIPVAGTMVLYFRFIMGYFMRNFEREADLAVFDIQPHPFNLISALEKIAILAGNIRNKPSWHHFSIAERVEFLQYAAVRKKMIKEHKNKLLKSTAIFMTMALFLGITPYLLPVKNWKNNIEINLAHLYIEQLASHGEEKPEWYMATGQLFAENKRYLEAVSAYEKALKLSPGHPDILNNYAWLLVTADDAKVRDPERALKYALLAAEIKPHSGYILDTLALCLFMNGRQEEAVEIERKALRVDPKNREYYRKQLKKFQTGVIL